MSLQEKYFNYMEKIGEYEARDLLNRITYLSDTEIIDEEEKIPDFNNDKDYSNYESNKFCVRYNNQVWVLIQPYNASNYPDTNPENLRSIWGLKHTKNPKKAKSYISPFGTSGLYMKDECYKDDNGSVWISVVDNNAYSAAEYPQNWRQWKE